MGVAKCPKDSAKTPRPPKKDDDGCEPENDTNRIIDQNKAKVILMNKQMLQKGAKIKYQLPIADFDHFK